ncbi:protein of unknown function [Candidatus Nitrosocosmicus franklandus]|uniref:Uncharacterized protein n=1 Tax=Candidatus Nitrosocosmicus franklandianus TaxID=1798806 RepID=A0A484IAV6_9ARCH|nr:protein of unknown function [Candidatus Nitrosocosmicus franklandus]
MSVFLLSVIGVILCIGVVDYIVYGDTENTRIVKASGKSWRI